jgi:hypothetical protein
LENSIFINIWKFLFTIRLWRQLCYKYLISIKWFFYLGLVFFWDYNNFSCNLWVMYCFSIAPILCHSRWMSFFRRIYCHTNLWNLYGNIYLNKHFSQYFNVVEYRMSKLYSRLIYSKYKHTISKWTNCIQLLIFHNGRKNNVFLILPMLPCLSGYIFRWYWWFYTKECL